MTISDKSRKLLWGRAASRCSICRVELVVTAAETATHVVVGDECHIVAKLPGGPRYRLLAPAEVSHYENLLLLCRNHHKLVDDLPETLTEAVLHSIKRNHESWVIRALGSSSENSKKRTRVTLLTDGSELFNLIGGAEGYDFDHDSLEDEEEVALVGGFLQSAHDWGEIWDDLELGGRVEARFHVSKQIKDLRSHGFLVYGGSRSQAAHYAGKSIALQVAMLRVLRESNHRVPEAHRTSATQSA